jgi:hypothetical protein
VQAVRVADVKYSHTLRLQAQHLVAPVPHFVHEWRPVVRVNVEVRSLQRILDRDFPDADRAEGYLVVPVLDQRTRRLAQFVRIAGRPDEQMCVSVNSTLIKPEKLWQHIYAGY